MQPRTPKNRPPGADDARPSDELTRQLRSHLRAEATELPAPRGPGAAVTRARARRRNRRVSLAGAAAVVAIAASSFIVTRDNDKADVTTAAQQAVLDQALGFDWTVTADGLNYPNGSSAGDSGLYALSTAPGTRNADFPEGAPRAMYRLSDDGTWVPVLHEGDDPAVGRVSERGGTLYALSTGTASSQDGQPRGSISTDGGETWSTVPLEMVDPPSDDVSWEVSYSLDVASTLDTTVAVVSASLRIPYEEVFPELYAENEEAGRLSTVVTDKGIDLVRGSAGPVDAEGKRRMEAEGEVFSPSQTPAPPPTVAPTTTAPPDPATTTSPGPSTTVPAPDAETIDPGGAERETEVVRTVTWSDLGITGVGDLAPQRQAYVAAGGEWTPVELPAASPASSGEVVAIDATSSSFVLSVTEYLDNGMSNATSSYRSPDGQTWEPLSRPGEGSLFTVGDSLAVISYDPNEPAALSVSTDGNTWTSLDLASLDPALADLSPEAWVDGASGPLGIALTVYDADGSPPLLLFSADLEHWSLTRLGDVIPEGTSVSQVIVGTDRVVVLGLGLLQEPGGIQSSATLVGVPRQR